MERIAIPPLRWYERVADVAMLPIMYLLSGTWRESPQQTHFWNNVKIKCGEAARLDTNVMVVCAGVAASPPRRWRILPMLHMPIFGGWRDYVVLEPDMEFPPLWHIGWVAEHAIGVSRITMSTSKVRVLLGPEKVWFFCLSASGEQLPLRKIGEGRIGSGGPYVHIPLL